MPYYWNSETFVATWDKPYEGAFGWLRRARGRIAAHEELHQHEKGQDAKGRVAKGKEAGKDTQGKKKGKDTKSKEKGKGKDNREKGKGAKGKGAKGKDAKGKESPLEEDHWCSESCGWCFRVVST
jgi:hypothetical protein